MGQYGRNVGFWGEGKTGVPGEKLLGAGMRTNKLSPHETQDRRIGPGPYWWEASALTTMPSLLPLWFEVGSRYFVVGGKLITGCWHILTGLDQFYH